ncbi:MAG TPA: DUF4416 family protein [Candidatus Latescibacteria bacterium]|nr:DUF4416 family protein [Candidatus Latescibacterota bacterium]
MSIPRPAPPVLLIAAVTWSPEVAEAGIVARLEDVWGPISTMGPAFCFDDYTEYYAEEMGAGLTKRILAFAEPVRPEHLADIKLRSNELERFWHTAEGARRVNIDPGYLCALTLVLASGKPSAYRIYLRDGIWAEITLRYERGSYAPLSTTYPDFRAAETIAFLNSLRPRALEVGRETR